MFIFAVSFRLLCIYVVFTVLCSKPRRYIVSLHCKQHWCRLIICCCVRRLLNRDAPQGYTAGKHYLSHRGTYTAGKHYLSRGKNYYSRSMALVQQKLHFSWLRSFQCFSVWNYYGCYFIASRPSLIPKSSLPVI